MMRSSSILRSAFESSRRCSSTLNKRDPTKQFEFKPADKNDEARLLDLTLDHFLKAEPHINALGLNRDNAKDLMAWVVAKALHYPYSIAVIEKASGKLAGFRLMSIDNRDPTRNFEPFVVDVEKLGEGAQILVYVLEDTKKKIWNLRPEANKILRREITFVMPQHQRKGIAQHLLHLNLDFERLKANGVDGIQSEASSYANQCLLAKNGYEILMEAQREECVKVDGTPVVFPDEHNVQLLYKNLR